MQTIKKGDSTALIVTTLKITSVMLFFVGAHLVVPKVTNAAASYDCVTVQNNTKSNCTTLENSIAIDVDLRESRQNTSSGYEPPNYGGPDSEHGSGTR